MARIVAKFGGTSVADVKRIKAVAERMKKEVDAGNQVAIVVSAMSGVTNQLVGYVDDISKLYDAREYDVVLSSGEQVTSGLLALALQELGVMARSWQGWQIPILTNADHSFARIEDINTEELEKRLNMGEVVVVPGFQGVGPDNRVTTLGRGGSDTSAVALAAALKADRCDIYTDVTGVYTADPRVVPAAHQVDKIAFEEMLELASVGAKVLQTRSVEMAMKHNVIVQVLSSFEDVPGTLVVNEEELNMEREVLSGIAGSINDARITLVGLPDRPGISATIFGPLADAGVNVDMIVQSISHDGQSTDQSFTVQRIDLPRAIEILNDHKDELKFDEIVTSSDVAKVSIVGVGMRSHPGVAAKMFEVLADHNINIMAITTSEIKVSVLIKEEYNELAMRVLHTAFGLDK
ncbi:MAG: aspartate kinase [Alphaproteobacteria bacterium]